MLNTCVLLGTIREDPVIIRKANQIWCSLIIETDRPFREADGTLKKDVFDVVIWRGIAEEIAAVSRPGMMIAIKGRMKSEQVGENGKTEYRCQVIAEHVTFPDRYRAKNECQ